MVRSTYSHVSSHPSHGFYHFFIVALFSVKPVNSVDILSVKFIYHCDCTNGHEVIENYMGLRGHTRTTAT